MELTRRALFLAAASLVAVPTLNEVEKGFFISCTTKPIRVALSLPEYQKVWHLIPGDSLTISSDIMAEIKKGGSLDLRYV